MVVSSQSKQREKMMSLVPSASTPPKIKEYKQLSLRTLKQKQETSQYGYQKINKQHLLVNVSQQTILIGFYSLKG